MKLKSDLLRSWVITLSLTQSVASAAGGRALAPLAERSPLSVDLNVHCRQRTGRKIIAINLLSIAADADTTAELRRRIATRPLTRLDRDTARLRTLSPRAPLHNEK